MTADTRFLGLPKPFWAFVRLIGQECGYTKRGSNELLVPSRDAVEKKIEKIGITPACLDVPLPCGIKTWDKLVGREILTRLPILVNEWCKKMP